MLVQKPRKIIFLSGVTTQNDAVNIQLTVGPYDDKNKMTNVSRIFADYAEKLDMYTPNLIPFLGNRTCNDVNVALYALETHNLKETIERLAKTIDQIAKIEDKPHINMLITGKPMGVSFDVMLQKLKGDAKKTTQCIRDVLFQLAYTLLVFEDFGLMHNYLTCVSIHVKELEVPLHYSVKIGEGKVITTFIYYFIQVDDFFNATKMRSVLYEDIINNDKTDSHIGNTFYINRDWLFFLRSMVSTQNAMAVDAVKELVDDSIWQMDMYSHDYVNVMNNPGNNFLSPSEFLVQKCKLTGNCKFPAYTLPRLSPSGNTKKTTEKTSKDRPENSSKKNYYDKSVPRKPNFNKVRDELSPVEEVQVNDEKPKVHNTRSTNRPVPIEPRLPVEVKNGFRSIKQLQECLNMEVGQKYTSDEIKKIYKKLAVRVHPDKHRNTEYYLAYEERMKEVISCYEEYYDLVKKMEEKESMNK
jgi:hypothetical protein